MKISFILKENCGHYNEYHLYYNNGYYRRLSIVEKDFKYEAQIINTVVNDDVSYYSI